MKHLCFLTGGQKVVGSKDRTNKLHAGSTLPLEIPSLGLAGASDKVSLCLFDRGSQAATEDKRSYLKRRVRHRSRGTPPGALLQPLRIWRTRVLLTRRTSRPSDNPVRRAPQEEAWEGG